MIVVIDTNILLVSISARSKHHWVYQSFLEKRFHLAVTTEILFEYEEIITRFMGEKVAKGVVQAIVNATNTVLVTKWFSWNLMTMDPDDNKFIDASVAAGADYIVTEDSHFTLVKNHPFPPVKILSLTGFKDLIKVP